MENETIKKIRLAVLRAKQNEKELGNPNPTMPPALINIFEKHGFYWGGNFTRKDGTHFEYFDRG